MNAKEFFNTVANMRQAQRQYFRTRSHVFLDESKRLEKIIDDEIDRVNRLVYGTPNKPDTPNLFSNE